MKSNKAYIITILLMGISLSLIIACLYFFYSSFFPWYLIPVPAYFTIVSLIFHRFMGVPSEDKPHVYINRYMMSSMFRLFIHGGALVGLVLADKTHAISTILVFLACYIGFTFWEVKWQVGVNAGKK